MTPLEAMLYALDRIFADSQAREEKSKELTVDGAYREFFHPDLDGDIIAGDTGKPISDTERTLLKKSFYRRKDDE